MCELFSSLPACDYSYQTRSIRLSGHSTSIRLEASFWNTLEEIADVQGVSLGRFLTKLHDEILEFQGQPKNFASLLRCACLKYTSEISNNETLFKTMISQSTKDFHI